MTNETLFGPLIDEDQLLSIARELGASDVPGWSAAEKQLIATAPATCQTLVRSIRRQILSGQDPLGELFCRLRTPEERRVSGATYTPLPFIQSMLGWVPARSQIARVVDPGCGSARFLVAAAEKFERAELVGVEIDPLAAIISRANLAVRGLAARSRITSLDFRRLELPPSTGTTLFIGNPPYVRHHCIESHWKQWLSKTAAALGLPSSQLCGLHLHFYLATALLARQGDVGVYITAAEWLDVNYGELLRQLAVKHLGIDRIAIVEPTARPFPDAAATAAVAGFTVADAPKPVRFSRVANSSQLRAPSSEVTVSPDRLQTEQRWTIFTRKPRLVPEGYIELGELFRVHRGQVTGANDVWVVDTSTKLPVHVLFPTVTKARELIAAGDRLDNDSHLRRVVDLPDDLDVFDRTDRKLVDAFLKHAESRGANKGYVAEHRKRWWTVGLREPAPILCTYMARRPPAFVRNAAAARHINIAHGLYPRQTLSESIVMKMVRFLSEGVSVHLGRTYAGGLTKFEPKEIERIPVPSLTLLEQVTK